ncbi:MAG: iron donor protein CyaY [Rhodospirillales bacterium]
MMDETAFEAEANRTLQQIMDYVDENLTDHMDADLQDGILNIELEDGRVFIINKHGPNRQIWLASPVSGASHYAPASGRWISTRSDDDLLKLLSGELGGIAGTPVDLG